jgi:hypothetical protein
MDLARLSGTAVAGGRTLLGVVALTRPGLPLKPWVGGTTATTGASQLLGRALGGRDLAIGLGGLWALAKEPDRVAAGWLAAGALADAADVAATVAAWRSLPAAGRVVVAAAAGGGVLTGAYAAAGLRQRLTHDGHDKAPT